MDKSSEGKIFRWRIKKRLRVKRSCWLAVRGKGQSIESIAAAARSQESWFNADAIAHSAAVRILVGDQSIRSDDDADFLLTTLRRQQEYY